MRRKLFLYVGLAVLAIMPVGCARGLALVSGGRSAYSIVISSKASDSEKFGANELSAFLEKISGARIPVVPENKVGDGPMILVGRSGKLDALGVDIPWGELGDEGYVIRTVGNHLVLAGSRVRGSMYACYGLLEDYLDCHWLVPGVESIPKNETVSLGPINETVKPVFEYRHVYNINVRNELWCARNRLNDVHPVATITSEMGGQVTYRPFVHSFFKFVPPRRYFEKHPEYFSEINGVRVSDHSQLCLSNPDVVDITTKGVLSLLRRHPEVRIVSVSQMDWGGFCTCKNCKAIDDREGSPAGSIITFINKVAERVEKKFPKAAIDTLAYQYSLKAPKTVKPRKNVIVRVCSIKCCFSHPLEQQCTPKTKAFVEDLKAWGKLTDRIYVWNYNINFSFPWQPHPNFNVLGPNARFFRDNHVRGVFEESGGSTVPKLTAMSHIRAYVMAKNLWNPDANQEKVLNDFLVGYFGPAANHIRDYKRLIHKAVEGTHLPCGGNAGAPYITTQQLALAQEMFEGAEKAVADNPELLKRVQLERLSVDWLTLYRAKTPYKVVKNRLARNVKVTPEIIESKKRFFATVKSQGAGVLGEKAYAAAMAMEKGQFNYVKSIEIARLANSGIKLEMIPELGGKIWSIIDQSTGRNFARQVLPTSTRYLKAGGYFEWIETPVRRLGSLAPFKVVHHDARSIKLVSKLTPEIRMERVITLPDKSARSFTVKSTMTNTGAKSYKASFRTHPEFTITNGPLLTLCTKTADGTWAKHDIKDFIKRQNTWLAGDKLPAGAWALFAPKKKRGVLMRFNPAQVGKILIYVDKERIQTLETYAKPTELKPGESLTVEITYEIIRRMPK